MAFLENSAANIHDLLEEFLGFAVLHAGFTRLSDLTVSGYTDNKVYVLQKGSIYWWFGAITSSNPSYGTFGEIIGRMMLVAPTVDNLLTSSLGQYYRTRISLFNRPNGPYVKHRLYSDGLEVYCVLEITPGAYTHFGIGKIPKYGTWTGGEFFVGSQINTNSVYNSTTGFYAWNSCATDIDVPFGANPSIQYSGDTYRSYSYVYNPARNLGNHYDFACFTMASPSPYPALGNNICGGSIPATESSNFIGLNLYKASKNTFNNRNVINGNLLYLNNSIIQDGAIRWLIAGAPALLRPISLDGINPGDTVEVLWDCYPFFTKGGDRMAYPDTGNLGIAYKRIV